MGIQLRALAIAIFTGSAIFWMLFGLAQYPWIMPADAIGSTAGSRASFAAAWLFALSLIAIWLPAGLFGRGKLLLGVTAVLLLGCLLVIPWLYPSWGIGGIAGRLSVHVLEVLTLLVTVIGMYRGNNTVGQAGTPA